MRSKNNNLLNEEERSEEEKNPNLKQVSMENVSSIKINSDFDVEIKDSYSDKISFELLGKSIIGKMCFDYEKNETELVIRAESKSFLVVSLKPTLYVNIPKKHFDSISVRTNNGNISIVGDINTDMLDISSDNADIDSSFGKIQIKGILSLDRYSMYNNKFKDFCRVVIVI